MDRYLSNIIDSLLNAEDQLSYQPDTFAAIYLVRRMRFLVEHLIFGDCHVSA